MRKEIEVKHKIIKVQAKTCEEVLLTIVRNEDDEGEDVVKVSAWHCNNPDNYWTFQTETVYLPNFEMCERFIADFSATTAQDFVDGFSF